MRLSFISAFSVTAVLPLCACTTYDGNRAIVPFVEIYDAPAATAGPGKTPIEVGEAAESRPSREIVLRPLGSFELIDSSDSRRYRAKVVWPIGDFTWGQGDVRLWTLPLLFFRKQPIVGETASDIDFALLPTLFAGHDPREGGYFAIFPLAGRIRGLLAKDEVDFFLFPLYWHTREGELDSLHLPFPLFNRVTGGGYRGWRLLPFYGHYEADRVDDGRPRYRRTFIGWPFYIAQENNLDSERPTTLLFSLPFYGQSVNPHTETFTYLWPFFHTTRDVATGQKLHFGYMIPYRFTGGQFDLWPLLGKKTQLNSLYFGARDTRGIAGPGGVVPGTSREELASARPSSLTTHFREFALWPIHRWTREQGDTWERSKLWVLPFLWNFQSIDKDRFETTSEWKLWPLVRYRRVSTETSLYFPSPLWFRQENLFERLYARLWRWFLYKNDPRRHGWELLYGLLSYRNEKVEEEATLAVFYGLLEWSADTTGHRFRVFYLPWR